MSRRLAAAVALVLLGCGAFSAAPAEVARPADDTDGGASTEAGDAAPAKPRTCTGDIASSWSTPRRLTELVAADGALYFQDPFVTADGLTLWVNKLVGNDWAVYRASRADRSGTFTTLTKQEGISAPQYSRLYPSASSPSEVLVTIPVGGASLEIGAATLEAGGGWEVTPFEELNRPDNDLWSTVSADGVLLVYTQRSASKENPFEILYQVERAAPVRSSPWGAKKELFESPSGVSSLPKGLAFPAITPDGLGLFYTRDDDTSVFFAKRAKRSDPFFTATSAPLTITPLTRAGSGTRVRSMTADGCEVYLTSDRDGVEDVYVATRTE